MNDLFEVFLDAHTTPELKEEIARSFSLFDYFEYNSAYSTLNDIIFNASNENASEAYDQFVLKVNESLDYILLEHTITTTAETTLFQKNEIVTALANIQKLEDYTAIIRTLESFESPEVQLSIILEDLTELDQAQLLTAVESFNPSVLNKLKQFIYEREYTEIQQVPQKFRDMIKAFVELFEKPENIQAGVYQYLGSIFLTNNIVLNMPFEKYLPFLEGNLNVTNEPETANHILSVILLSEDGQASPLDVYRQYSLELLQDLNKASSIETHLVRSLSKLNEYLKVKDEKARLS